MENEQLPEPTSTPEPNVPTAQEVVSLPAAMPVAAAPPIPGTPAYRDRSTGLMLFGILQIILGLLAALMVPLVTLGVFLSRVGPAGRMRPGQYISTIATYVFAAVVFLILGFGSIQARRWARALTLVISWYWLVTGILITVLLTAVMPVTVRGILAQAQQNASGGPSPNISTAMMAVVLTIMIVFMAFFLIAVPIAFVIFYSRSDVEQTCRNRDPVERWTDKSPLPVLGASIVLFTDSLHLLMMGIATPLFPFFGRYLAGIRATACFFAMAALVLYLARAIFRLELVGWWIAVVAAALALLSTAITYARADLMAAYSKLGLTDQQLKIINSTPMFRGHIILWWSLLSLVIFFGYLLWLKRYFKQSTANTLASAVSNLG